MDDNGGYDDDGGGGEASTECVVVIGLRCMLFSIYLHSQIYMHAHYFSHHLARIPRLLVVQDLTQNPIRGDRLPSVSSFHTYALSHCVSLLSTIPSHIPCELQLEVYSLPHCTSTPQPLTTNLVLFATLCYKVFPMCRLTRD